MKRKRNRILSLLTAGMTAVSLLPSYFSAVPSAAALPSGDADGYEDDTDLTIDFSQDALDPEAAFSQMGEAGRSRKSVGIDYYRSNYNQFHWRHVRFWTCNNNPAEKS